MTIEGSVDALGNGVIAGWAVNTEAPEIPLQIQVFWDGEVIAQGCANQFRQDLYDANISDGRCGFHIPLSSKKIKNGNVTLSVRAIGFDEELRNSPITSYFEGLEFSPASFVDSFAVSSVPWIDLDNWEEILKAKINEQIIDQEDEENIRFWRENGFVIFRQAASHTLIDHAWKDYDRAWVERPFIKTNTPGKGVLKLSDLPKKDEMPKTFRFMDFHNISDSTAHLMMNESVIRFLKIIFEEDVVAMQTLTFEFGTQQRAHMDFPYVHTHEPIKLAAAWVACEDVSLDAGPLFYYPGSHLKCPKYDFGGGNLLAHGDGPHIRKFESFLAHECEKLGLERVVFCPNKGDILIWHSALVHGGSPRNNLDLTRKSIVSHYSTSSAYPRDRRYVNRPPVVKELNGGVYYALDDSEHEESIYPLR